MKKLFVTLSLLILVGVGCSNKQQIISHPTQDEWLEVYTAFNIRKMTDVWERRVAVIVKVFSLKADGTALIPKEIIVTITAANGEESVAKAEWYKPFAEGVVKSILEQYNVDKEYKIIIQLL